MVGLEASARAGRSRRSKDPEQEGGPLSGLLREALVIHFIDNTSAIAALVRGYSGMPDSARLVHAFHAFNVGLQSLPWFAHVRSAANVSDGPSRGDVSYVRDVLGASFVESRFPDLDLWLSPAGRWMDMALADAPRSRSRGRDRR